MKRCVEFIMGVCLLLAVFMLTGPFANIWTEQGTMTVNSSSGNSGETKEEQKLPVIALDAGHGGDDPGKIGINGALEKDINLAVVKKVKALLEERNVAAEVILTRENEEGLYSAADSNKKIADLNKRCRIIEENKADFVVSVHQNSYNDGAVFGAQVFYYRSSEEGKKLAEAIQDSFNGTISSQKKRAAKANGDYYMLLHVSCPIVIAECGFLSNWEEAEKLKTDEYQDRVAEAICQGIVNYLKE